MNNSSLSVEIAEQSKMADSAKAVLVSVICLVVATVGNGMLAGIIYYEKYGMDPGKRNLFNRLVSQVCWARIIHNVLALPFVSGKFVFGSFGMFFN